MQRIVEVVRLEEARDAVVRLVVDEDGAEQRLLGLDVVGGGAEGLGLGGAGASAARRRLAGAVSVMARELAEHSRRREAGAPVKGARPRYAQGHAIRLRAAESGARRSLAGHARALDRPRLALPRRRSALYM